MKEKIVELHSQGMSYNEISALLGCSKGTISYHVGEGQKEKTRDRQIRRRASNPIIRRTDAFKTNDPRRRTDVMQESEIKSNHSKRMKGKVEDFQRTGLVYDEKSFTSKDVMEMVGDNPVCHISGRSIDLLKPRTYQFDHIVPRSKGGGNTLDNLGIAATEANIAKSNLSMDELLDLCADIFGITAIQ